jgi:chaperonin GroEL
MNEISNLSFHSEAREKMIAGVKKLAAAVSVTLGPKGKNVAIIRKGQRPHLTKDGVTVANAINLPDPFENLGCQIVKEAAQRTADVAGDGTTTSTVLASALLISGHRLLEAGYDARKVTQGMERACSDLIDDLERSRVQLSEREQLVSVASISANGEQGLGELIAEAIEAVGSDGPITVENAKGFETQLEIVEGTVIDQGYVSPYFVTNQAKGLVELDKPYVILINQTLSSAHSILPVLEIVASSNRPVLIVANDYSTEALQSLVMNKVKGALRVCAIKAPEFGNARTVALQDLAVLCGGQVLGSDGTFSKDELTEQVLGSADRIIIDKNGTVLIGTKGGSEAVAERIANVQENMEQPGLTAMELGILQRRRRRMSDGIAIIRVGGATEADMLERRDRVDDALCASKAAKSSGIQPGGGIAMVRAAKRLITSKSFPDKDPSYVAAYESFLNGCYEPFKQIVANAGESSEVILQKVLRNRSDPGYGYNAATGDYGDMYSMKVIDPHAVVVSCLKHAASVACNILLIGCAVSVEQEQVESLGLIENL